MSGNVSKFRIAFGRLVKYLMYFLHHSLCYRLGWVASSVDIVICVIVREKLQSQLVYESGWIIFIRVDDSITLRSGGLQLLQRERRILTLHRRYLQLLSSISCRSSNHLSFRCDSSSRLTSLVSRFASVLLRGFFDSRTRLEARFFSRIKSFSSWPLDRLMLLWFVV